MAIIYNKFQMSIIELEQLRRLIGDTIETNITVEIKKEIDKISPKFNIREPYEIATESSGIIIVSYQFAVLNRCKYSNTQFSIALIKYFESCINLAIEKYKITLEKI